MSKKSIFSKGDRIGAFEIECPLEWNGRLQQYKAIEFASPSKTIVLIYALGMEGTLPIPKAKQQFLETLVKLQQVSHPGIPRLVDGGWTERCKWMAIEMPAGTPLIEKPRLNAFKTAVLLMDIAETLHACAKEGVHGRLGIDAILLDEANELDVILEFGVTQLFGTPPSAEVWLPFEYAGEMPEKPSESDDIFAAAVIAYRAFTRCEPYESDHLRAEREELRPLSIPDIRDVRPEAPEGLAKLLLRWMSRETRPKTWAEALPEVRALAQAHDFWLGPKEEEPPVRDEKAIEKQEAPKGEAIEVPVSLQPEKSRAKPKRMLAIGLVFTVFASLASGVLIHRLRAQASPMMAGLELEYLIQKMRVPLVNMLCTERALNEAKPEEEAANPKESKSKRVNAVKDQWDRHRVIEQMSYAPR